VRRLRIPLGLLAAAAVAAAAAWFLWTSPGGGIDGDGEAIVRIPRGATLSAVADSLVAHDRLARRTVFVWGARLSGRDRAIRAGRFSVPAGLSPRGLLRRLVSGPTVPVRVTVLEGETAAVTAESLAAAFPWSAAAFLAAADSLVALRFPGDPEAYRAALRRERARTDRAFPLCEGYLHTETYHFAEAVSAAHVAGVVLEHGLALWRRMMDAAPPRDADVLPGLHEVLTLASIVEAETPRSDEMPRVAAVYLNRLTGGIALEADPTVAHAVDKRGERILYVDLEVDSAFNTYRHRGLPPGPIGSPGPAAVDAVLRPATGFDALFFVADGSGGHVFSRTLAEHREAVRRYRALRESRTGR